MFKRIFIINTILIIFVAVTSQTYSQNNNGNEENWEFNLLITEYLMQIHTYEFAEKLLKGDTVEISPRDELDMSPNWWNLSTIKRKGNDYYCDTVTYLEELEEWKSPDIDKLEPIKPLDPPGFPVELPEEECPELKLEKEGISSPNLAYIQPTQKLLPDMLNYKRDEVYDLGVWNLPKLRGPWKWYSASGSLIGGGTFLSRVWGDMESITEGSITKEFESWPPEKPTCWTACAKGRPYWEIPFLDEKIFPLCHACRLFVLSQTFI